MMTARDWLARLHALAEPAAPLRILNVCGGHERTIAESGLRSVLPGWIQLLPGPGCPVCVCPEESLWQAIRIALDHPVTLVAFGDMLRVPVNAPAGEPASLLAARGRGADIRPVASPLEVLALACELAPRPVVFFVAGFETTLAPVAAMRQEGVRIGPGSTPGTVEITTRYAPHQETVAVVVELNGVSLVRPLRG